MRFFRFLPFLLAVPALFGQGPTPAFTLNTYTINSTGDFYIGIEFNVSVAKTVTALGIIDTLNTPNLPVGVGVGIYSVSPGGTSPKLGTHVASAIVPSGTSAESIGVRNAFFTSIAPVTLAPGNYVILGDATPSVQGYGQGSMAFQSGISYVNGWFAGGSANFPGVGNNVTVTNQSNGNNNWPAAVFKAFTATSSSPTSTSISVTPNPGTAGIPVTITANVSPSTATGSMTFLAGGNVLGNSSVVSGTATLTVTLAPGNYTLTANYGGDPNNLPSASGAAVLVVNPAVTQAVVQLTTSSNPSILGQPLGLTATVSPSIATGSVIFRDNGQQIGSATLSAGRASINVSSLPFGTRSLTAFYPGDTGNLAATSNIVSQRIVYPALSITTPSLPSGRVGIPYGPFSFSAQGGSGSFSWSAAGLPAGLSMSGAGSLSGTPTAAGSSSATITVTDTVSSLTASQNVNITVEAGVPVISGPATLGNVLVGGAVSASYTVSGGRAPFSWSISGAPGVSIDQNGRVSGSAAAAGSFTASIVVTDANNSTAGISATLTVLGLATASLPAAQTIADYSASISAIGGAPPYTFEISGLPAGLTASGGAISGRPTSPGTSSVSVKVTDSAGLAISTTFTLVVTGAGPLRISSNTLPAGTVNQPYSQGLAAAAGSPPYSFALSGGVVPEGLSLSGTGTLSGTPTRPGSYSFGAQVTDAAGAQVSGTFGVVIAAEPLRITNGSNLPSGVAGVEYPAQSLTAAGGTAPYTFSSTGGLPAGLALASGQISGTPVNQGSGSFSVTVTDSSTPPVTATAGFSITVRPNLGDLVLSGSSVNFALTNGASAVPAGASISVSSSQPAQKLAFTAAASPAAPWLSVTSGGSTPGSVSLGLSSAALTLGAAGSPYSTSVIVTCTSSICAGRTQSVSVVLTVTNAPPQLSVAPALVSLTASGANPQPVTGSITILNAGGGTLTGLAVASDASWLTVGAPPTSVAPGPGAQLTVTANPAGLRPGYYRGTVSVASSAGRASVPVTLLFSADSVMTLAPAGTQLNMSAGGVLGRSSGSFLVGVNSTTPVAYSASVQPGAPWLVVTSGSGTATSAGPGTVGFAVNSSAAAALTAGAYYGTIRVSAAGIVNAPQDFQVILNVAPGTIPTQPDPQPAGLLFLTSVGSAAPPAQTVTLFAGSTAALAYQASADGGNWLSISSTTGSTSANSPAAIAVTANPTGLAAGIYRGGVSVSYAGTAVRTVNVTLVVQSTPGATSLLQPRISGPTCTGGTLVPAQTGLVSNFAAPTSWPTPLAIRLVDTCGSVVGTGQIVATFSNGDPPLALTLVDSRAGLYSATWTPRRTAQQVTINARATATGYPAVTAQIAGQVTPNEAPSIDPNGAQDVFRPLSGGGLGPGNIIQIYGRNLASQIASPAALPLPTTVSGTRVLIGGVPAPLFYVSPGQVNAQVPFELGAGKQYQIVVNANGALTAPQPIQLNAGTPSTLQFTSGLIVAQRTDGSLIDDTAPARPGEDIVFYMTGLGATDADVPSGQPSPSSPPARVKDTPVVTLNGNPVTIDFAGLTPGLVGLYQINLKVPATLADGAYKVEVAQSGVTSNSTTLTVRSR